jgi:predicted permease
VSWGRFFRRRYWDDERKHEIEAYLEIETAENIARGMEPGEARYAARRKFGRPTQIREEIYRMNTIGFIETIWQDLRYGVRLLRLSPGFTLVAILSLALGIGANTAIFQLLDAVRMRNLPVHNPRELAEVRIVGGNGGMGLNPGRYGGLTRPAWQEIRDHQQAFSGIFAWSQGDVRVGEGSDLRRANAIWVSGEFFVVLGVEPLRGRLLLPEDETTCPAPRAVVSYSYWQSEMGGVEIGPNTTLMVDRQLVEVVGVTPPRFFGLAVGENFDMAFPLCQPKELRRDVFNVGVIGRLHPGWTIEQATAHFDSLSAGVFEATAPTGYSQDTVERYKKFRLAAYPAGSGVSLLRAEYDASLWLLLGITGLVLLIACANLANLMLARASAREREIAVRLALGASRVRLLRQLIAESALLAAAGAALGMGLAQILSRMLVASLSAGGGTVHLPIETDWRVLLFASAVAVLTCVVFGAVPAIRATRSQPEAALRGARRGMTAGRRQFSLQRSMVVTQIAVSLVLLVGALLFVRSFRNLMTFDAGMRQEGITFAFLGFQDSKLSHEQYEDFQRQLLDEIRSVPGVVNAATTTHVPLIGGSWGHGVRVGAKADDSRFTWVSPDYFATMGIPLIRGRLFNLNDTSASQRVAVVNETFVRNFIGDGNPIGVTLRTSPEPNFPSTVYEIVGLVADSKYSSVRGETPEEVFAPGSQYPALGPWASVMIHSSIDPAAAIAGVRGLLSQKHPEIVAEFSVFRERIRDGMVRERLMAMLSGFFGLLAAVLAMVGLYGVISYIVARRRNEIGIRIALGAGQSRIVGMILRDAGLLLAIGLAAGSVLALAGGQAANSLLFGLTTNDPVTFLMAAASLAGIALVASYLPARRAANLEPTAALREE